MRILVLNYEFPPLGGGAGNATACLAREWARRGHEVEIVTGGFRGLPRVEQREGFPVRRIRSPRARQGQCSVGEMGAYLTLSCLPALWRGLMFRPDIAIAFFSLPSGPAAWLLRAFRGTPYVVSLRGGDVPGHLLSFVNAVAHIANTEDHHPDLELGYNYCRMKFSTHSIGGLSENDFICAAKIDALATE